MLGFIILLLIALSIWAYLISSADIQEVNKNWPKYRCRPGVMPFASFYGHDTAENFNFCLSRMFNGELGDALGPLYMILGTMITSIMTLIQVANSLRVQMATMMGGVNTVFQNFTDRFRQLLGAVSMTGYRMKLIFGRLYGAFFAMIYMATSGIVALQNFQQTVLFDFLNTFCFDPDTLVEIEGKGKTRIQDVKIGDVFLRTGGKVTATFSFESDGQEMVYLPGGIEVSRNHYIYYLGTWRMAGDHPEAKPAGAWAGGNERPLICLNTSDHKIPVGHYMFLDYDETDEGDKETMAWVSKTLNGKEQPTTVHDLTYNTCISRHTEVKMKDGSLKEIQNIQLGEDVSTGRVVGIIQKQSTEFCETYLGEAVTPGLLFWQSTQWVRAGEVFPIQKLHHPQMFYSLVVLSSAQFETKNGMRIRDYVEVHSPETEQFYTEKVTSVGKAY